MSASRSLLLLAIFAVALQQTGAFKITDCTAGKNSDAKLKSISISTCPDATGERCNFIKGRNATLSLEFELTSEFKEANIKIAAKIGLIYIPFKLAGPTDACNHYGLNCPSGKGEIGQMAITLPVLRVYPSIKTIVHFELNDEFKKPIICFEFPVQLKDDNSVA